MHIYFFSWNWWCTYIHFTLCLITFKYFNYIIFEVLQYIFRTVLSPKGRNVYLSVTNTPCLFGSYAFYPLPSSFDWILSESEISFHIPIDYYSIQKQTLSRENMIDRLMKFCQENQFKMSKQHRKRKHQKLFGQLRYRMDLEKCLKYNFFHFMFFRY